MKLTSREACFIQEEMRVITRLRELRKARGMTQSELAAATHVTPRTIISIEAGRYRPSLMLAYRLAVVLGTTVEELCCLRENMEEEDRQRERGAYDVAQGQGTLEGASAEAADCGHAGLYGGDWRDWRR